MKRANTSSGREHEAMTVNEGARKVAEVMKRQEKVQGSSNGGKFEIISENQAHHARSNLGAPKP
jgi:hypothetical protein